MASNQGSSLPYKGLYWIVEDAVYLEGYKVKLWFRDGSVKIVDLGNELTGEMFEPLRDISVFANVKYDEEASTIVFLNGADFAPEFLYDIGVEVDDKKTGTSQ